MRLCGVSRSACANFIGRRSDIDPVDFGPRRHHLAHRPVGEPHDARNHRPFVLLQDPGRLRFRDDEVQLLRRDLVPQFAVQAQQR